MLVLEPSKELIWEEPGTYALVEGTMTFSVHYIDPMKSSVEIRDFIAKVFDDLTTRFKPWVDHYVWDKNPVEIELVESGEDDVDVNDSPYIFGKLEYDQVLTDQDLVAGILFEMSKIYPDVYVHMSDSDGEFLLVEAYEHIPDWIDPSNSYNRDWLNNGRILIIPEEYYSNRGLKLIESLKFLERAVYKCDKVLEIDELLGEKYADYSKKALQGQCELDVTIPRILAGLILKSNATLLNRATWSAINEPKNLDSSYQVLDVSDLVELKIRITTLCYASLEMFLKQQNDKNELHITKNELVTSIIASHAVNEKLDVLYSPSDEEVELFNKKADILQKELIRLMKIDEYVEPKFESFDDEINPLENEFNEEEMMGRIKEFFDDNNAGIDGVENKADLKSSVFEDLNTDDEEDEEDNKNREMEEILRKEGIDEDDFFEFFAKEALKLKDEDLEQFRNLNLHEEERNAKKEKENNEEDEEYDSEEERELLENLESVSNNDMSSLKDLLNMLASSGTEGPTSTFLQNLGKE